MPCRRQAPCKIYYASQIQIKFVVNAVPHAKVSRPARAKKSATAQPTVTTMRASTRFLMFMGTSNECHHSQDKAENGDRAVDVRCFDSDTCEVNSMGGSF